MLRIDGRSPKASGQMITAGCAPLAGVMNAASQVPSGVLISTFVSVPCCCAPRSVPAAAIMPAATVVTESRRVSSSFSMVRVPPPGGILSEHVRPALPPCDEWHVADDVDGGGPDAGSAFDLGRSTLRGPG